MPNTPPKIRPERILSGFYSNLTAITDPTLNDDVADDYTPGSRWVNTITQEEFVCVSNTAGNAIWKQTSNDASLQAIAKESPNEHFLGSILDYPSSAGFTIGEIQYTRIWLTAGMVMDNLRVFIDSGGTAARNIRLGIYSNSISPADPAGVPNSRLIQTNVTNTAGTWPDYLTVPLTSTYEIQDTGYYWTALIADSSAVQFAVSNSYRGNFLPVRRESGTGTTLPATAGTLTNPTSALAYVAAVEEII